MGACRRRRCKSCSTGFTARRCRPATIPPTRPRPACASHSRPIAPSAACVGQGEQAQEAQGARAILAGYVDEGLERLPDLKREDGVTPLGADKELGREILKVMVTSHKTKSVLTHDELVAGLVDAGVIQRDTRRATASGSRTPVWGWSACGWCAVWSATTIALLRTGA